MSRSRTFEPPIAGPLNSDIVFRLACQNASISAAPDAHAAEAVVQAIMVELLTAKLPSAELIFNNIEMPGQPHLKGLIPDIIIDNADEGVWGIFEIKTLLKNDNLSVTEVEKDLAKLCAYKKTYKKAAAVFVLVGSRSKLFNPQRAAAWSDLKISYDHDSFSGGPLKQQEINEDFVAIPCGSFNVPSFPLACFMWEIQPRGARLQTLSSYFRFKASMI
ncbi:hypothetical protein K3169_04820 [Pseudomonas phytophila]|uniref:PD-(D/E)XK nuclease superfamily protein n=1 Tax=Pseudomonas phytophila TaxID=2867264 RepID=A0ABY6FH22_9PSED|nr:hypothetical protein [Pseudomonas phytophila]UXZ97232.1 hypothetical protein K3169_04820 [Pseudomonas phytophila]